MHLPSLGHSLSALLVAIVAFAIGLAVVLRDRERAAFRAFAALCLNLCLFDLATFVAAATAGSPRLAHAIDLIALVSAVLLPGTSFRFFRAFLAGTSSPEARPRGARRPAFFGLITVALLVAIAGSIAFPQLVTWSGTLETVVGVWVYSGFSASVLEIWAAWRRTVSRVEKTRLMYLLVGGLVTLVCSALDLLPHAGVPFPPIGNVAATLYIYFLSQTLFRYRLLDLNELLGRMVVLAAFVLLVAVIYFALVVWIPPEHAGVLFFNGVIASFVIVILFDPLRNRIEGQINKWMFREKHELRERIDALRLRLANIIDVREAVRAVVETFEESHRATHAAVYLVDQEGAGYELAGHLGPRPAERLDAAARRPFFARMTDKKGGGVLSLEQLAREQAGRRPDDPANEELDAIARALDEANAGVCVPILAHDQTRGATGLMAGQLLGLLCLKDERLREAYGSDEIDLFRGLAAQLAITLQNSKVYERMKERDRLAALGEMAAGLAHEIRNPLGAIKGAAQFLEPAAESSDSGPIAAEARQFLGIIVEEVNRLNRVVSQFLDYARPYRGELSPCDLNEVVRRTLQLLPATEGVEVQLALDDTVPRVRADAEQLRQVFLNLAINALQAMPEGGRLTVATAARPGRRGQPALVDVRFRDTGTGIAPPDVKNLFIPFFTTKDKGTGLGLPISQRIIENHGGRIEVRSPPGGGATFTVVLPAEKDDEGPITSTGKHARGPL